MERTSILRLLRSAATLPQNVTSRPRYLCGFALDTNGLFRYSPQARPASLATYQRRLPPHRISLRFYSTPSDPPTEVSKQQDQTSPNEGKYETLKDSEGRPIPTYQLTFTCKPCTHRSVHSITKQSYHYGAVLVQCPGCKARHVISDHLRIFSDKNQTIEDILKDKGQYVKRGTIDGDGDTEFWSDEQIAQSK